MSNETSPIDHEPYSHAGIEEDPSLGYSFESLIYTNPDLAARQDACMTRVASGGRTPIYEVIEDGVVFTDTLIKGRGVLVRFHPSTGVSQDRVDSGVSLPTFQYRIGTMFAWVADETDGLEIFGTNTPPFQESQERQLPLESPEVPESFRVAILGLRPQ